MMRTAGLEPRAALEAFDRAIAREAQNLGRWPELLWQQLHNRLQWEGGDVESRLGPELKRRARPGSAPWMRTRAPFRESAGLIRTMGGDAGAIRSCAVTPDGSSIISSGDGALRIWDTETGRIRAELSEVTGRFALGPDGTKVLSSAGVWNLSTGRLEVQPRRPYGLESAWVPGAALVVGGWGKSVIVSEAGTGTRVHTLQGHTSDVRTCAVSPEGSLVVSGGGRVLKVWDTNTGDLLGTFKGHTHTVKSCGFAPSGRRVISGGDDAIRVWDATTCEEIAAFGTKQEYGDRSTAVSLDGRLIAGNDRYILRIWDLESGNEVATLEGHTEDIPTCAFSPDGSFIVSGSTDGTLRMWALGAEPAERVSQVAFDTRWVPPDQTFVDVFRSPRARAPSFRHVETGAKLATLAGYSGGLIDRGLPEVSSDRSTFVTSDLRPDRQRTIKVWDIEAGRERSSSRFPKASVHALRAISADGSYVLTLEGSYVAQSLELRDTRTLGKVRSVARVETSQTVLSVALSPDGSFLVTGVDHDVKMWNVEAGRELRAFWQPGQVSDIDVSPDGSFVVSAGDRTVYMWNLRNGQSYRLEGHDDEVRAVAVSSDARRIFSVSDDSTLRIWDVAACRLVATLVVAGKMSWVEPHPWRSLVACGTYLGYHEITHVVELVGIDMGSPFVTPVDRGAGPVVRCPVCDARFPVDPARLGKAVACSATGCGSRLRVCGSVATPRVPDAPPPPPASATPAKVITEKKPAEKRSLFRWRKR